MSEISLYEAQVKKMQGICDEHDLVYRFKKDSYPITFTIKPAQDMESQMSMLENVEEVGYRSPDASMMWIFEDGTLTTKVQGGTFTIGKTLRTKIEAILVKMINYWQQFFFRDIIEKRVLAAQDMPTISGDDGGLPEGAEPLESFEDEDDGPGNDGELPKDDEDEADEGASTGPVCEPGGPRHQGGGSYCSGGERGLCVPVATPNEHWLRQGRAAPGTVRGAGRGGAVQRHPAPGGSAL